MKVEIGARIIYPKEEEVKKQFQPHETDEMIAFLYEKIRRQESFQKLIAWAIFVLGVCMLGSSILK